MKSGSWSHEELEILKNNYQQMTDAELSDKLNRSKKSVKSKRQREDFTKDYTWNEHEEQFIKDNWREMSDRELSEELDRSLDSIRNRRKRLDISRPDSHLGKFNDGEMHWTEEKEEFLKNNYKDMSLDKLTERFGASKSSIKTKAERLGVRKVRSYSEHEIELIERLHYKENSWTLQKIADYLGLNYDQVANAVGRYDIQSIEVNQFVQEELDFIKNNYKDLTNEELAEELNRNTSVVAAKKTELGIYETPFYSDEEEDFIRENWQDLSDSEIAEELDRGLVGIKKKRRKMGLKFDTVVDTDIHYDWEEICVEIAEKIYDNVFYHKVFDRSLVPDIYVPEENLVIDAKLSVYEGAAKDVKKYLDINGVEKVELWSYNNFNGSKVGIRIFDRSDLVRRLDDDSLKAKINKFSDSNSENNTQTKLPFG